MSNSIASRLILKNPCISLLESCKTMKEFNQIHAQIYRTGLSQENLASTKLFEIFCSSSISTNNTVNLDYARKLFDQIPVPNAFTWNTMIKLHSKAINSTLSIALLYKEMLQRGTKSNGITFSFVSKGCSSDQVFLGLIHAHILEFGFCCDGYVLNSLTYGYSVSGSIDSARKIFDQMWCRDLVSWTVMINGYVRMNRAKEAIDLFFFMREEQVGIDEVIVVAIFTACAQMGDLNLGRRLESLVRESGVEFNSYMMNALIDMYSKCGSITDAWKQFDEMLDKNSVSWNSIVSGYGRSGDMKTAKNLFEQMPKKNEISWSALLNGYLQNGNFKEALMVFNEMRAKGVVPNDASIAGAIAACTHLGALELGQEIHLSIDEQKVKSDVVLGTALVDMYVKCGCLEISRKVFDGISHKNVVSYNVMMLGLAVHGRAPDCFEIFAEMLKARLKPDGVTFVGVFTACAHSGCLEEGKEYFNKMTTVYGISPRIEHISCMVHLMGRNGSLVEAYEFIKASPLKPDVVVWGALLGACKVHGNVELGESVAKQILELDPYHGGAYVQLSSLNASAKRWDEVSNIRKKMKEMEVESRPGCSWIELNGNVHEFRAGDSLHSKIKEILLMLGLVNVELGESVAKQILELDPYHGGAYVQLSSLNASAKRWNEVSNIRKKMKEMEVESRPGCSWIELNGNVHEFRAGDSLHSKIKEILLMLGLTEFRNLDWS